MQRQLLGVKAHSDVFSVIGKRDSSLLVWCIVSHVNLLLHFGWVRSVYRQCQMDREVERTMVLQNTTV